MNFVLDRFHEVSGLLWREDSHGVWKSDGCRTAVDGFHITLAQVVDFRATRVFRTEGNDPEPVSRITD